MSEPANLTSIATADLQILGKALQCGEIDDLAPESLAAMGLGRLEAVLSPLSPMGRNALTVLQAVLAERRRPSARLELVWTGPEQGLRPTRDTGVVVRELFCRAQRDVIVAGYSFDHGQEILRPLHEAMRDRGVEARILLHIQRTPRGSDPKRHLRDAVERFERENWPFGLPRPKLYFDPRTVETGAVVSLHAKCVVVDRRWALVGSANFTNRGQHRNLEVGILVDDPDFAGRLSEQWLGLLSSGQMQSP